MTNWFTESDFVRVGKKWLDYVGERYDEENAEDPCDEDPKYCMDHSVLSR